MYLWLALLAALAFTTGGVAMKHANGIQHALPVSIFMALFSRGAVLQSQAMRGTERGVTYILVLGLEAALAFGMGIAFFGEAVTLQKTGAVALIVAGIALLRTA